MSRETFEKFVNNHFSVADYAFKTNSPYCAIVYTRHFEKVASMAELQMLYETWQACEAEQSKRIAKLEGELKKFKDFAHVGASMLNEIEPKYKKLQAQNAELVEALIEAVGMIGYSSYISDDEKNEDISVIKFKTLLAKVKGE